MYGVILGLKAHALRGHRLAHRKSKKAKQIIRLKEACSQWDYHGIAYTQLFLTTRAG